MIYVSYVNQWERKANKNVSICLTQDLIKRWYFQWYIFRRQKWSMGCFKNANLKFSVHTMKNRCCHGYVLKSLPYFFTGLKLQFVWFLLGLPTISCWVWVVASRNLSGLAPFIKCIICNDNLLWARHWFLKNLYKITKHIKCWDVSSVILHTFVHLVSLLACCRGRGRQGEMESAVSSF